MPDDRELQELKEQVQALTARLYRLENLTGHGIPAAAPPQAAPLPPSQSASAAPPPEPPLFGAVAPPPRAAFQVPPRQRPAGDGDLERRIGSEWLNRIGIVALLFGVAYFLKYAFENDWIGPAGRVAIGLIAGIAVIFWSERFRHRDYLRFSWSLKAVGVGVMYLSLWAAFQLYHLVPAGAAFFAMIVVTASTAALALKQDAQILAAYAIAGGFLTPVLISTGQNRQITLFSYIALLDLATLVIVRLKPWSRLLLGSFTGTLLLYIAWYDRYYTREQLPTTLLFATLFFVIFAAVPLVIRASDEQHTSPSFSRLVVALPLMNAAVYFIQLYAMLEPISDDYIAFAALALGAVFLGLAHLQPGKAASVGSQAHLLYLLHVGIAIAFITIAIPLKLESHWITIGWLVESAVLLWIGYRAPSYFVGSLGLAALILGLLRLIAIDNFHTETLLLNMRFFTFLVALAIVGALAWVARHKGDTQGFIVATVVFNILALLALNREAQDYFSRRMAESREPGVALDYRQFNLARDFTYSAIWLFYGVGVMIAGFWQRTAALRWQALFIIALTIGKVFIYDLAQLEQGYRILSFIALGVVLLFVSFIYQRDWLKLNAGDRAE